MSMLLVKTYHACFVGSETVKLWMPRASQNDNTEILLNVLDWQNNVHVSSINMILDHRSTTCIRMCGDTSESLAEKNLINLYHGNFHEGCAIKLLSDLKTIFVINCMHLFMNLSQNSYACKVIWWCLFHRWGGGGFVWIEFLEQSQSKYVLPGVTQCSINQSIIHAYFRPLSWSLCYRVRTEKLVW